MRIMVVGSGAREHALIKALSTSMSMPSLFCCATSNNPGIRPFTTGYWIGNCTDCSAVLMQAKQWEIELAIIGPEAPLEAGLADALSSENIAVIGPKKILAQLETSKGFTRDLMHKFSIPGCPDFKRFSSSNGIIEFLSKLGETNYVVKADGLMGGKGVRVAGDHLHSFEDALKYCDEIFKQGQSLVVEEKLIGQEFSLMSFTDGDSIQFMPVVQDNKRAYVGDKGPNTGGMGSYSDSNHSLPFLKESDLEEAKTITKHVLDALMKETQDRYMGILYGGFIATAKGVYVIEFNARFGDPETMNVLSILETDFVTLCTAISNKTLNSIKVSFAHKATVCKYAVPEGYPDKPLKNVQISIDQIDNPSYLYLASVHEENGHLYATGSRTAAYVGVADSIEDAEVLAENGISKIKGPLFHREDIGTTDLIQKRIQAMAELRQSCYD